MTDKELIERLLAEREAWRKLAEMQTTLAEEEKKLAKLKRHMAYIKGFNFSLARALRLPGTASPEWPKQKRAARWKGADGYELVSAVLEFQAANGCNDIAPAIKLLRAKSKKWEAISQRDLERRFQDVRPIWEGWWREARWLDARAEELLADTREWESN